MVCFKKREVIILPIPEERQKEIHKRLNYVQGQINGIKKMVDEERYCVDVLTQISSTYEGLRKVAFLMMRNYMENCVTNGIRSDDPEEVERMYNDVLKVFHKYSK
jgi:DNA-binding FrmR family transcriptional regulator